MRRNFRMREEKYKMKMVSKKGNGGRKFGGSKKAKKNRKDEKNMQQVARSNFVYCTRKPNYIKTTKKNNQS